ncbi:MAG: hypothetical protein RLP13_01920 [Cytophagales bacterium]|uniref:hypothetical protein n=1 Tax=Fulvivirga sp. TaxID=1931237 RepID=UPI003303B4A7
MQRTKAMINLGWVILIGGFSNICFGQETTETQKKTPDRFITYGLGTMIVKLNDEHMSDLNYKGGSVHINLGGYKRKKNTLRNFQIGIGIGSISPKDDNRQIEPKGQYYRVDLSYSQQYFIQSILNEQIRWYSGGKVKSHTNIRLNPQLDTGFITFLLANGFFASNTFERDVKMFSRMVIVGWQLDLPLLNHTIRPSFLNVFDYVNPEGNWVKERVDDSRWYAINKYSNITSTIYMLYPLSSSNIIRLSYEWDFYRIKSMLEATSISSTISFSLLFKF